MTGRTREYLADLALRKGVSLPNEQERDQAWASNKIDELNALPDVNFPEISEKQLRQIDKGIRRIITGIEKWTFEE